MDATYTSFLGTWHLRLLVQSFWTPHITVHAGCCPHGQSPPPFFTQAVQDALEGTLGAGLVRWGEALTSCPALDPSWQRLLGDPFLRQFTLR